MKLLQLSGHYMYHQFNIQKFYVMPTKSILSCVDLRTKQPLFPYTILTDWFYNRVWTIYSPVVTICTTSLTLNISTFCPHSLCVLHGSEKKKRLFPYITLTDLFYNRDWTLKNAVDNKCTTSLTFNISTFCPHRVFLCLAWISELRAIIPLYNINWLVFITEIEYLTA